MVSTCCGLSVPAGGGKPAEAVLRSPAYERQSNKLNYYNNLPDDDNFYLTTAIAPLLTGISPPLGRRAMTDMV